MFFRTRSRSFLRPYFTLSLRRILDRFPLPSSLPGWFSPAPRNEMAALYLFTLTLLVSSPLGIPTYFQPHQRRFFSPLWIHPPPTLASSYHRLMEQALLLCRCSPHSGQPFLLSPPQRRSSCPNRLYPQFRSLQVHVRVSFFPVMLCRSIILLSGGQVSGYFVGVFSVARSIRFFPNALLLSSLVHLFFPPQT